jgi:hypothetical protein
MNLDLDELTLGLHVELSLLRDVLATLRGDGKHWWVIGDPTEAPARGVITIAYGYEECYDRLNTLYFDTPVMSIEGSNWGECRFVVIIERSQWLSHEPGFYVEAGQIIEDTQEDLDCSFYAIQSALIKRLRRQGS